MEIIGYWKEGAERLATPGVDMGAGQVGMTVIAHAVRDDGLYVACHVPGHKF